MALRALDRGGTLAVAGIWLSAIPGLDYAAELFQERRLRSVTANTRAGTARSSSASPSGSASGRRRSPTRWPRRRTALADLAHGRFGGAAVLTN